MILEEEGRWNAASRSEEPEPLPVPQNRNRSRKPHPETGTAGREQQAVDMDGLYATYSKYTITQNENAAIERAMIGNQG